MMKKEKTTFFSSIEEKENILNDFENYLRAEGQRLNTIRGNSSSARNLLEWLQERQKNYLEISYNDLLDYVNYHKEKGNSKSTINGRLQGVRHFYNHLQQQEKVSHNPSELLRIKGIIRRQPHDLLEWEELEELYKNYPTSSLTGKRNKSILGMMIYQGLNSGEVAKLELKDIKLEEGKIDVQGVSRSNNRTLKLAPEQLIQLQKYITQVRYVILAVTGKESEKLFVTVGDGHRLSNGLPRLMRMLRQMNPKVKSPKQIRASVITLWLKQYHVRQVQYMTGHRYVSSTEYYRTDLLETLQEQLEEMHPLK